MGLYFVEWMGADGGEREGGRDCGGERKGFIVSLSRVSTSWVQERAHPPAGKWGVSYYTLLGYSSFIWRII